MQKKCCTHSGPFHADEVLASVILKLAGELPDYDQVIRSRDKAVIAAADIVYDVGGEYDVERRRFDHHQRGRSGECWADETPLSSAGLIWRTYRDQICPSVDVQKSLEKAWIIPVDADDNGSLEPLPRNARHVSSIVSEMNPPWDDEQADVDALFAETCQMLETLFRSSWRKAEAKLRARQMVEAAVKEHQGSTLLVLPRYCPWKAHLFKLEEELGVQVPFRFVLFGGEGTWKIFQVPVDKDSKEGRAVFPEPWGGLREEELREASGVSDAVFVHPSLFCGGALSLEGAKQLALKSIALGDAADLA
jgi:uncharacterized UPF0160 family protein